MKADYADILALSEREPSWYDAHGVPRFAELDPDHCPNIYATLVAFFQIECQHCQKEFIVEIHATRYDAARAQAKGHPEFAQSLHYGDPPAHKDHRGKPGCTGETMNSVPRKLIALYERSHKRGERWQMIEKEGRDLTPDWAKGDDNWW